MNHRARKNRVYSCLFHGITAVLILFFMIQETRAGDDSGHRQRMVLLTIGDSNGEGAGKWPDQLQRLLGEEALVINNSVSGRTIGFDNLGQSSLNTLKQIQSILESACRKAEPIGGLDKILICLGTNDCKAVFDSCQLEVTENYRKLIQALLTYRYPLHMQPKVIIISPPPYGKAASLTEKYKGADQRVQNLIPKFRQLAETLDCPFVDIYTPMLPVVDRLSVDGDHFSQEGYRVMAEQIRTAMQNTQPVASTPLQKKP
jgi:lysophospholipase L1-like esterase